MSAVHRQGPAASREGAEADATLVARAVDGDEKAADALVSRHVAAVYRVVLSILEDEEAAADSTQETFLKALRGLRGFRGEASFRTWLLSIAVNEARGSLRRSGRRRALPLEAAGALSAPGPDPEERAQLAQESSRVRECLARLPEKQRMAVTLRIFEGLSFREVGEVIGSSEGAARVNYHHGIRKLREWLA